jgi:REP element-mobilizing transposase RayT
MSQSTSRPRRRSIRLPGYDYSQPGYYFITVCTHDRECLFGEVRNAEMVLSEAGRAVRSVWTNLPNRFPGIDLDEFVVMPNHVHGILVIANPSGAPTRPGAPAPPGTSTPPGMSRSLVGAGLALPVAPPWPARGVGQAGRASPAPTDGRRMRLGDVVGAFKSLSAVVVNRLLARSGQPLWQRNYFEHVVRGDAELQRIRQYVVDNPAKWAEDRENPLFQSPGR